MQHPFPIYTVKSFREVHEYEISTLFGDFQLFDYPSKGKNLWCCGSTPAEAVLVHTEDRVKVGGDPVQEHSVV